MRVVEGDERSEKNGLVRKTFSSLDQTFLEKKNRTRKFLDSSGGFSLSILGETLISSSSITRACPPAAAAGAAPAADADAAAELLPLEADSGATAAAAAVDDPVVLPAAAPAATESTPPAAAVASFFAAVIFRCFFMIDCSAHVATPKYTSTCACDARTCVRVYMCVCIEIEE